MGAGCTRNSPKKNRIISADATGGSGSYSESYIYDPNTGNLYSKGGQTYTYGNAAHKHAVTAAGSTTFSYDANGNMQTRTVGGVVYNLNYDAENRLVTVTQEISKLSTTLASFVYDGDGQRVKGTVNGTTTYYVGDYYEKSGTTVKKYYYANGTRIAMNDGGTTKYLFGDHLGSMSIVTDDSGNKLTPESKYKAWGEARAEVLPFPTTFRFTGQRQEMIPGWVDGLYFYNSRWYDPYLNRWLQPDTIVPDPGNPLDYDRYAYVRNAPTMYTDPGGHRPCDQEVNGVCISEAGWRQPVPPPFHSPFSFRPSVNTITHDKDTGEVTGRFVGGSGHGGTDYSVTVGTDLYASAYGIVIIADYCSLDNCVYDGVLSSAEVVSANQEYGNVIVIEYPYNSIPKDIRTAYDLAPGESLYMVYAHLDEILVETGDIVYSGQLIGRTGDTGNSTGPHLHLEVRKYQASYIPPGQMCGASYCYPYTDPNGIVHDPDARYRYLQRMGGKVDPEILHDYFTVDQLYVYP